MMREKNNYSRMGEKITRGEKIMFKKNTWIAGLLAALAIMFVGCVDPYLEPDEDTAGMIEVTLVDLQALIKDVPAGTILTAAGWQKSVLGGTPFMNCGEPTFTIVDAGGGKKALQVSGYSADWGQGIDVRNIATSSGNTGVGFKSKDKITIKGTAQTGHGGLQLTHGGGSLRFWDWNSDDDGGVFNKTFELTSAYVTEIEKENLPNRPATLRIHYGSGGDRQGVFAIEELVVKGMRPSNFTPPPVDSSYRTPDDGVITLDIEANRFYFYVNLNEISGSDKFAVPGVPPTIDINPSFVKLTYATAGSRPTVVIALTDEQTKRLFKEAKTDNNQLTIEWDIEHTIAGNTYRYSVGNKDAGGASWNAQAPLPNPFTDPKVTTSLPNGVAGDNPNTNAIVFQQMGGVDGDEVSINSIKISWAAPDLLNPGVAFAIPAIKYGDFADQELKTKYIKGTVVKWEQVAVEINGSYTFTDAVLDYPDTEGKPNKKYGRLDTNIANYVVTYKISPNTGYKMDDWTSGMPLYVTNGVDNSSAQPGDISFTFGKYNTSYNHLDQTVKVLVPNTGASKTSLSKFGDNDTAIGSAIASPGFTKWSLVGAQGTISKTTESLANAGSVIEQLNGGIYVSGTNQGSWIGGLDIIIAGAQSKINLTPASRRYRLRVNGFVDGTIPSSGNPQMQLAAADSPWSSFAWANVNTTTGAFSFDYEIPEDYLTLGSGGQTKIRIQANNNDADSKFNDFRVSNILIEDFNVLRIPVKELTLGGIVPVVGEQKASSALTGAPTGTNVSIAWKNGEADHSGRFAADTAYTAVITLRTNGQYSFRPELAPTSGPATVTVTGADNDPADATKPLVTVSVDSTRQVTITATFPKTDAGTKPTATALTVTKPVIDGTLVTTAPTGTGFTSSAVSWYEGASTTALATLKIYGSTAYTAKFTLTVADGYSFKGAVAADFGVSSIASAADGTLTATVAADGRTVDITAVFAATDAPTKLTGISVSITAPVINVTPTTTATPSGTGVDTAAVNITWSPAIPSGGVFNGGVAYTATVTLKATAALYTFNGSAATDVTSGTATTTSVTKGGNDIKDSTATVVFTFPATAAATDINSVAVITLIAPAVDAAPQQTVFVSPSQVGVASVSAEITWKKGTTVITNPAVFDATTGITAEFTLRASPNYKFAGSVSLTGGSGTAVGTPSTAGDTITFVVSY
jgi:hypothetical protein